jgi:asparagine synthase (glutamine-hydrolysing)
LCHNYISIMCGIFSLLNNDNLYSPKEIYQSFYKGKHRGPENSQYEQVNILCEFGFHRLAINGLDDSSGQPIHIGDITLICNGEIYNYRELYDSLSIHPVTNSDCEIIIHLYLQFGIEYTLQKLDGVFAFILCDSRIDNINMNNIESKIYVARDPYGVRPLYKMSPKDDKVTQINNIYAFASEIKCLTDLHKHINHSHNISHFEPGTYSSFTLPYNVSPKWKPVIENRKYHSIGFTSCIYSSQMDIDQICCKIRELLFSAVNKRVDTTERPIACLLSGGLDSSIITALVRDILPIDTVLETYSIGLEGSEDLKHAKIVAEHLKTKHTEIIITEDDFLKNIPDVIKNIESYDTTTVRASIGNYLIGKYISEHSDAKVIFNGDGSDELTGGYLYMGCAPSELEFDNECIRLLEDIHQFDVLRSDKCISSNGLEPRTPFLDRSFVQFFLSIHPLYRFHKKQNGCEKYLLRHAFDISSPNDISFLPENILWRTKEAFSDGVSKTTRSLFTIIQEYVNTIISDEEMSTTGRYKHNQPTTKEQLYYRKIYDSLYPDTEKVVPYFWMPKWIEATDASARTLSIYNTTTSHKPSTSV